MKKYITLLLCVAMLPVVMGQRGSPLSGGTSSSNSGGGGPFNPAQFNTNASSQVSFKIGGATTNMTVRSSRWHYCTNSYWCYR
jgi:hypothetical protein